jgi:predicted amino acid dehydrogenase
VVRREDEVTMQRRADEWRDAFLRSLASDPPLRGSAAAALAHGEDASAALILTCDPAPYWKACRVVVTATSALSELVSAANLAPGAIVCDVSRPMNVARRLQQERPDVLLIEGGVLVPPPPFDSGIDLGIGRAHSYACMAETMLLALERDVAHATLGSEIDLAHLPWLADAARRVGFSLAEQRPQTPAGDVSSC